MAIVVVYLCAILVALGLGLVPLSLLIGLCLAGALTAVVGFFDDHGHIAARWRLLAHFVASLIGLWAIGGMPAVEIGSISLDAFWLRTGFAVLYLVWMLNLYNFMDGIDGIASTEAISVCLGAGVLYLLSGDFSLIAGPLLLASAVLGFLLWNLPPAKIFMGDAGSGFLGITLGILAIHAAWTNPQYFWAWCILLGVFIVDATLTLLRRWVSGAKVYEAHRTHAYQFASRHYAAHGTVTIAVAVINIVWLLPIAVCVVRVGLSGFTGVCIAYAPLVLLAFKFKAGNPEVAR